jgi:hypothetical protein
MKVFGDLLFAINCPVVVSNFSCYKINNISKICIVEKIVNFF